MARFTSSVMSGMALVLLTGCATIAGSGPERIAVDSTPAGADVRIECNANLIGSGVTPTAIMVPRSADYCVVAISRDGYESQKIPLDKGFNPRYWANLPALAGVPIGVIALAFGGNSLESETTAGALLGLGLLGGAGLVIDSVTDAKYDHDPKTIKVTLKAIQ